MVFDCPRVVFAALRGNAGKTFVTLGVGACLNLRGMALAPFKKGPDYIDAAWLELAAGRPCHNLDLFLMGKEEILYSFRTHVRRVDGALVEGNRGLYDGMDQKGSCSTAELAKLLRAPVILVTDCGMATRTVAAAVLGCQHFDPEVAIKGVILNRIGGSRHESVIRRAVEDHCGLPVVGALPRSGESLFPERHMGLLPPREYPGASLAIAKAAGIVGRHVDVDRVWEIARSAPAVEFAAPERREEARIFLPERLKIGIIRDSAFWFYYPENLEVLEKCGASLVECSALSDKKLPPVDALYIGGGFPESHAEALAANESFRRSLREAVERGLPVYAECGGLMYLGKELLVEERLFPMTGVFPLRFVLERTPQGHGYTVLHVDTPNPYYRQGEILHGHEFHYSRAADWEEGQGCASVFQMKRGRGIHGDRDGLLYKNVLATYSHVHASGVKGWVGALLEQAEGYRSNRLKERTISADAAPGDNRVSRRKPPAVSLDSMGMCR